MLRGSVFLVEGISATATQYYVLIFGSSAGALRAQETYDVISKGAITRLGSSAHRIPNSWDSWNFRGLIWKLFDARYCILFGKGIGLHERRNLILSLRVIFLNFF